MIALRPDGSAVLVSPQFRGSTLLAMTSTGSTTRIAGNEQSDIWQGDGVGLDVAVFPPDPTLSELVPGPDGKIYAVRAGGLAVFDPATGLTSSVSVPGLITTYSVYTKGRVLGFDSSGRVLMRSVVPTTSPPFGDHQIVRVDLAARTFEVLYGPTTDADVSAVPMPNGDVLVVDHAAATTSIVNGSGTTVVGVAPASSRGLYVTPAGEVYADGSGVFHFVAGDWVPQPMCVGDYPAEVVVQDGARLLTTRLDVSGTFYEVCSFDTTTGTEQVVGTADYLPAPAKADADGYVWTAGLTKTLVRVSPATTLTVAVVTTDAPSQQFAVAGAITGVISQASGSVSGNITPGASTVRVTATPGFGLDAISCSDDDSTGSTTTGTISVNATEGEQITCTVTASGRATSLGLELVNNFYVGVSFTLPAGPIPCDSPSTFHFQRTANLWRTTAGAGVADVAWDIPLPANPSPAWTPVPSAPVVVPAGTMPAFTVVRHFAVGTVTAEFSQAGAGTYECADMLDTDTTGFRPVPFVGLQGAPDTDGFYRRVKIR